MIAPAAGAAASPAAPRSLETTGLHHDLLHELTIKLLYFEELSGADIAARLGLRYALVEPQLGELRRDHLIAVTSGSYTGAPSYCYRLSETGREHAAAALARNRYVGPAPVAVDEYRAFVAARRSDARAPVTRRSARAAFSHLVLTDALLDLLGPAAATRHSLIIYGPPGTGKTVIAQGVRDLLGGNVPVPYALLVHGQIVRLFDPAYHEPAPEQPFTDLARETEPDRRWVLCRRPLVLATGGLGLDAFALGFTRASGFYQAPLHIVANGGILIVDDVTRQRAPAVDLLNRLMGPLENRVDHLLLSTGQSFELPFDAMTIVTTDVNPASFMEDMFLRRIRHKMYLPPPSADEFIAIFNQCCAARGLACDAELIHWLLNQELAPRHVELRRCHPRDLIEQALALASYLERPPILTRELLAGACGSYFLRDHNLIAA